MSDDFTLCQKCNRNSHGNKLCLMHEQSEARHEAKVEELGYEPPVRATKTETGWALLDKHDSQIAAIYCNHKVTQEMAEGLAEFFTRHGEDYLDEDEE